MPEPKTIADLGRQPEQKIVVGKSMLGDEIRTIKDRIRQMEQERAEENRVLEAGGYDYGGNEMWIEAMQNIGRR